MNPTDEILKLKDGECWIWPESDYGQAEIWFKNERYFLFEIPQFGGNPRYIHNYSKHQINILIEMVKSWT